MFPFTFAVSFTMSEVQCRAMQLEHPQICKDLDIRNGFDPNWSQTWVASGHKRQVIRLIELVEDWLRKPATDEQLALIFGEGDK
jgi:hypothetical protein